MEETIINNFLIHNYFCLLKTIICLNLKQQSIVPFLVIGFIYFVADTEVVGTEKNINKMQYNVRLNNYVLRIFYSVPNYDNSARNGPKKLFTYKLIYAYLKKNVCGSVRKIFYFEYCVCIIVNCSGITYIINIFSSTYYH